jgi:hypothetical protein
MAIPEQAIVRQVSNFQGKQPKDEAPGVILNVYPLLAKAELLADLCSDYLNDDQLRIDQNVHFQLFGSFVYLIVMSEADGKPNEVAFSIPVKWYRDNMIVNLALVSPYVLVEEDNDAIIDREWNGRPTMDAALLREAGWPDQSELVVKTDVIPQRGGQVNDLPLVEIHEAPVPPPDVAEWPDAEREIADKLVRPPDDALDAAKVLALEMLTRWRPIKSLMLKQFREADDPTVACYQEILRTKRVIMRFEALRALDPAVLVKMNYYESHPLVETFGLVVRKENPAQGEAYLQPVFPFQIRVQLQETSRIGIYWRQDPDPQWEQNPTYREQDDNPQPVLGRGVLPFVRHQPDNPVAAIVDWLAAGPAAPLTDDEVLAAVNNIPEPLAVIVNILRREW